MIKPTSIQWKFLREINAFQKFQLMDGLKYVFINLLRYKTGTLSNGWNYDI